MLPLKARTFIALTGLAGAVAIALTVAISGGEGVGRPAVFSTFTALLAVNWVFPLLLPTHDEAEAVNLDEAFLVAMLLVLPPLGVVLAYGIGTTLGSVARRRPLTKTVFNVGQQVAAAGAALAVSRGVIGLGDTIGPRTAASAAVGAAVYLAVNSCAVSAVIAMVDGERFRTVWLGGAWPRILATVGGACVGLLAGIAAAAYDWALIFVAIPLVLLFVVTSGQVRARRDRERMLGVFQVAVAAHASMARGSVERTIADSARDFLRARSSDIRTEPPGEGELGALLVDGGQESRWLIVSDPRGGSHFDDADQAMLESIVAIARPALDNAALYAEVASERKKMTDVVTSSSDGIFSVDGEQRVQSWNPAMERITGIPAHDAIGTKDYMVFRPRDTDGDDLARGEPVNVQITTLSHDLRWLTCTYSPLPDGGYVVVARDITAQKQIDDLKADFLATVSHELRTPLTPIQGFLHTLLREDVAFDDDQRRRFYEVMLRQSERLERLVKDLLDATSLQDSESLFLPEQVDWAAAVSRTLDLFRTQEPGRVFVLEVAPSLPYVVADEQRAEQILSNLVSNAIKYSPENLPVRVSVEEIDGVVRTTVYDAGPGVPPGDRDRIFERFTRLGDHLTRRVGGAGLGLFIAKRLVEAMGGEITVDAAPEGGAAFSFTLPPYAGARTIQL